MKIGPLSFIFSILLVLVAFSFEGSAEKIVNLYNGEWPPYSSQKLKYNGLGSRIISESMILEGVTIKFSFVQWKRGFELVKKDGQVPGTILWTKTKEREKYFYFSEPILVQENVFFHMKSKALKWDKVDDLKGKGILKVKGYNYGDILNNAFNTPGFFSVIDETDDDLQALKMLMRRSSVYDIFPAEKSVGQSLIKANFSSEQANKFTYHPKGFLKTPLYLIVKKEKKNLPIIEAFNKGLKKLKESGKFDEFIRESENGNYQLN